LAKKPSGKKKAFGGKKAPPFTKKTAGGMKGKKR